MTSPPPQVLLVEDEGPIRRFLRASLAGEGYGVTEARSAEEALRLAAQQPPDLVVLDLGLPDLDGHEVSRRLREWSSAPILILSARERQQEKIAALDAGGTITSPSRLRPASSWLASASPCATRRGFGPDRTQRPSSAAV